MAVRVLAQRHASFGDFLSPTISGFIALYLLVSVPGTVLAGDDGLEKVYWLRKNKRIRWEDIETIETDGKNMMFSMITITGTDGTEIIHSWLLADRPRLLLEIQKHCAKDLPPEFPREAADEL